MDWVGHSDISVTMGIYAEVNKAKNLKEYDKINNMFAQVAIFISAYFSHFYSGKY